MTNRIIRIETDGECFISFGDQEKPPGPRDESMMLVPGSVNYFKVADDRAGWAQRIRHWFSEVLK